MGNHKELTFATEIFDKSHSPSAQNVYERKALLIKSGSDMIIIKQKSRHLSFQNSGIEYVPY